MNTTDLYFIKYTIKSLKKIIKFTLILQKNLVEIKKCFKSKNKLIIMNIQTNNFFKYKKEELSSDSDEYNFVKNFFVTTANVSYEVRPPTNFKVFRIIKNSPMTALDEKSNNLMLFHGTTEKGADSILKEGFKNSEKGWFGRGVYLTDCSCVACNYSGIKSSRPNGYVSNYRHVLVNEVLGSEKLRTKPQKFVLDEQGDPQDHDAEPDHPFVKHVAEEELQAEEEDYIEDALGRRYRNVDHDDLSSLDEFVADKNIVLPRYLLKYK